MSRIVLPLSQERRQRCSIPISDADLSLGNANWTKGLQAMSDWIWSGHLNPEAFPNNLARYFLQIPGVFEQQLNFSTTLIFDEPSYRNGIQVSGFLPRVAKELAISLIAQRRRSWYSMTHHAILGRLTAAKHGLNDQEFREKWCNLLDFERIPGVYSSLELEVLRFADAFSTNPKGYSDDDFARLRGTLATHNEASYPVEGVWISRQRAAQVELARCLSEGLEPRDPETLSRCRHAHDAAATDCPDGLNAQQVNAQLVELAFLCLQFVALTCVFSGLNVPDEDFLAGVMQDALPAELIDRINSLNIEVLDAIQDAKPLPLPELLPPAVDIPIDHILAGHALVEPAPLRSTRELPLVSYENATYVDRDKGLTVGGISVGTWGWGFGSHFPGSLVYCLMNHPELARYEAPYSLPVLFNEDEWRNGTQTAGYVGRRLKEIVIQKVYKLNRCRYGIEHHTMFLYNTYLDEHGVGRPPHAELPPKETEQAKAAALDRAHAATAWAHAHRSAPPRVYTDLELAAMDWTQALLEEPHTAFRYEPHLREQLVLQNAAESLAGLRRIDHSPGVGAEAAMTRLVDHQISSLCMMIGHMDGLGRVMTILQLPSEDPVAAADGYFQDRPGLLQVLDFLGLSSAVKTVNELCVNPDLAARIKERLARGERDVRVSGAEATRTGEF